MKEILQSASIGAVGSGTERPRELEVVVEIPRGGFLKRGSTGRLDFVSPIPCPFNYGSVPDYLGGEGDLLDAIVLGPRLRAGTRVRVPPRAAIGLAERHMYDDKLVCATRELTPGDRLLVWSFMHFYARCKGVLNRFRGYDGATYCTGWGAVEDALSRAMPTPAGWTGSPVGF